MWGKIFRHFIGVWYVQDQLNMSTQQKQRKKSQPNLSSERVKLVSTDR